MDHKVILLTGGGSGIGQVTAQGLARDGHHVTIVGRNKDALVSTAEGFDSLEYVVADITNSADIEAAITHITQHHGRLDVVINNAGMAPVQPFEDLDMAEFDRVYAVNVRGLVDVTRQALPLLKESRGSVINLSSSLVDNPLVTMAAYSSAKAAVNQLSKVWAKDLARHGVRVNYLSVGPIESPIYEKTDQSAEERQAHIDAVTANVPLGRFGTAEEVTSVIRFLISDQASYVTGADYAVDGGFRL
ncbi:SDR family NAD(P)-dependent oxidoreductase [Streptomyces arenae]|uniref:SDR family NAD(P)-dependent oxidoreductase n=1 Tax=Streptomyces arenae TaxID=29301 RepID=UPI0026597B02|nr:SDR family oxidoreductase [Streptomyces arenae]MCG7202288.1 SDR family oxidoreductase [Streptomyces arenae]